MSNATESGATPSPRFPDLVASIIDEYTLVLNRGRLDGVKSGQRFLIYSWSKEEIKDPATGETLGHLEIVKGTGAVTHLQERLATIVSDRMEAGERTIIRRRNPFASVLGGEEQETVIPSKRREPFDSPAVGDKARPI